MFYSPVTSRHSIEIAGQFHNVLCMAHNSYRVHLNVELVGSEAPLFSTLKPQVGEVTYTKVADHPDDLTGAVVQPVFFIWLIVFSYSECPGWVPPGFASTETTCEVSCQILHSSLILKRYSLQTYPFETPGSYSGVPVKPDFINSLTSLSYD